MNLAIFVVVWTTAWTLAYKVAPYRPAGEKKPLFAFLPKYRKRIRIGCSLSELESRLASIGFEGTGIKNNTMYYRRGSLLGDFSVKLIKVKLGITELEDGMSDVTLEASWVAAFDTGDFWSFITELSRMLEETAPLQPAQA